jgi:hypothetical protein
MTLSPTQPPPTTLLLQPALEWSLILGFGLLCAGAIVTGISWPLRLLYPAGALVLGIVLYSRHPILYVGFTWWLWFLSAWVRRVVDFQSGWQEPSVILLAPYLCSLVAILTLLNDLPRVYRRGGLPFVVAFASVVYGLLVGVIRQPFMGAAVTFLDWVTPIVFGYYIYSHWRRYPDFRRHFTRVFLWGAIVMGGYGIWQYMVAPAWDGFWIESTGLLTFGRPEPREIRVFSTMHSNGPFAVTMMAALLLLLNRPGLLGYGASAVGYLSFLLSLTRSAWIGWFLGILVFASSLKSSLQIRIIVILFGVVFCALPLTLIEPFSSVIGSRLGTFTDASGDVSYNERMDRYNQMLGESLTQVLGQGFGGAADHIDSAILDMFFSLGWVGTVPYLLGLVTLLLGAFQVTAVRFDPFASAARAIGLGVFVQLVFGSVMTGASGVILWTFLGLVLAAQKYYRQHPGALIPNQPMSLPARDNITIEI